MRYTACTLRHAARASRSQPSLVKQPSMSHNAIRTELTHSEGIYYMLRPLIVGIPSASALAAVVAAPLPPSIAKPTKEKRILAPKVAYIKGKCSA